jgi:uncharacterized protein YqeY
MQTLEELKSEIKQQMLARNKKVVEILKVVAGECETLKFKNQNSSPVSVIEKIIVSNNLCLQSRHDEKYVEENNILSTYLPKYASVEEIMSKLGTVSDNSGATVGKSIKLLKQSGIVFKNEDVKTAIERLLNN